MKINALLKIFFFLFLFSIQSASAQYTLFEHSVNEKYIELYVSKSALKDDFFEFDGLSNVGVLSSQFFCKSGNCLVAEIPYSYANYKEFFSNEDKTSIFWETPDLDFVVS